MVVKSTSHHHFQPSSLPTASEHRPNERECFLHSTVQMLLGVSARQSASDQRRSAVDPWDPFADEEKKIRLQRKKIAKRRGNIAKRRENIAKKKKNIAKKSDDERITSFKNTHRFTWIMIRNVFLQIKNSPFEIDIHDLVFDLLIWCLDN